MRWSPNGPSPSTPFPVSAGSIAEFAEDPVLCMRRLWAKHGNITALQEDNQRLYFAFGPEWNHRVLSDPVRFHSSFFAVRGPRKSAQRRVTSGLLSMNGDEHRQHRRVVMEPFQKRMIASYHDTVVELSQEMLDGWRQGEVRDLNDDMTHYMLRLTSRILFGIDESDLAYRVGELTERWVELNHRVGPAAFSSNLDLTAQYDELLLAAEELEDALREMIRLRRSGKLGTDVLSIMIRIRDAEGAVSEDQLIGHMALLFAAAHLTSAHTLTWALFLLSQHPEVMRELYGELDETLDCQPPGPDQLDSLPVLDRVLKESMRILPASAYSLRVASEPVELGPFQVKAGSVVIFSQFITHHLPELFSQPERFLPDRWKTLTPSPYAYLPFGAGPRMCIGAALGMMQLKISLPSILGRYKVSVQEGADVDGRVQSTMLYPVSRVPVVVTRQDGVFTSHPIRGNIHTLVDLPPAESAAAPLRRAA